MEPFARPRAVSADQVLFGLGLVLLAGLGILTFATSFHTGQQAAARSFGAYWDMTPVAAVDIGIVALSIFDVLLIRKDARMPLLRPVVWVLIGVTFAFNTSAAAQGDRIGLLLHGAIPLIYVATWEAVRFWVLRHFQLAHGQVRTRLVGPRLSRYVLSPIRTPRVRRFQILEEIEDFPTALAAWRLRDQDPVLQLSGTLPDSGRDPWDGGQDLGRDWPEWVLDPAALPVGTLPDQRDSERDSGPGSPEAERDTEQDGPEGERDSGQDTARLPVPIEEAKALAHTAWQGGRSAADAARQVGRDPSQVRRWYRTWNGDQEPRTHRRQNA